MSNGYQNLAGQTTHGDGWIYIDDCAMACGTDAGGNGLEAVTDPMRVRYTENLTRTPADGIVDSNGNLSGSYTSYAGSHGHPIPWQRE